MGKKYDRIDANVLSSNILALIMQKPRTVTELTKEIYGVTDRMADYGRVYRSVEILVNTKALKPVMNNGVLKFDFNGFK